MGEFKKRIDKETVYPLDSEYGAVINVLTMKEIVESAKKEFPLILVEPLPDDHEEYKKWSVVTPSHDDLDKLAEWFVRWFMDSADKAENAEK